MYQEKEVKELASDKAFSKLMSLDFQIKSLQQDIENNRTGGVTLEELIGVLDHEERDREVWNYIFTLIEKNG